MDLKDFIKETMIQIAEFKIPIVLPHGRENK